MRVEVNDVKQAKEGVANLFRGFLKPFIRRVLGVLQGPTKDDCPQRVRYIAEKLQMTFGIQFSFLSAEDLRVFQGETLLVLTTDYTVYGVLVGDGFASSGMLTLNVGATEGDIITIESRRGW